MKRKTIKTYKKPTLTTGCLVDPEELKDLRRDRDRLQRLTELSRKWLTQAEELSKHHDFGMRGSSEFTMMHGEKNQLLSCYDDLVNLINSN